MSDTEALDDRLRAVERALTGDDTNLQNLENAAELRSNVQELENRLDALETKVDDIDAATQALRGYVGNVRSVNKSVERRADAALAAVDALEGDPPNDLPDRHPPEHEPSTDDSDPGLLARVRTRL